DGPLLEGRSIVGRKYEVAGSHARSNRLREGRRVGDQLPALELEEARGGFSFEANEAVWIVLQDWERVLAGELDQACTPLGRERSAAWILKSRERVEGRPWIVSGWPLRP